MNIFRDAYDKASMNGGEATVALNIPQNANEEDTRIIELQAIGKNRYAKKMPNFTSSPARSMPDRNYYSMPALSYQQRYTAENLQRLKRSWKKTSTDAHKNKKDGIKPTSPPAFSEEFRRALGEKNTSNIQGIDDAYIQNAIFIGFIEREACHQHINKSNQTLTDLLHNQIAGGKHQSVYVDNNKFYSRGGYGEVKGLGAVAITQAFYNIPYMDAVATLAYILGVDINNFYSVFKVDARIAETKKEECGYNNIFQDIRIPGFTSEKSVMSLINFIRIYGHSGQIIGGVCVYQFNNITFCIPATVVRGKLSIGKHKPPAYFLNQDKIDKNPNCKIILCQDIRLAIALDKMVQESKMLDDWQVVVTGHIGTNLSALTWNYFYGHQVILICAASKQSYSAVKGYKKYLDEADVVDPKFYSYPILHEAPPTESDINLLRLDELEEELYQKKTILSAVDSIYDMYNEIVEKAIEYGSFVKWGKDKGLFTPQKCDKTETQLALPTFTLVDNANKVQNIRDVGILHILPCGGLVTSHGKKDVGKSYINITIIIALLTSSDCLGFKANINNSLKCLLLDSETLQPELSQRILQFGLEKFLDDKSFHVISVLESEPSSPWANFDLSREEHRQMLEAYCQQNGIKYMFLDNLTSLTRGGVIYNPIKMCAIFEWMEQLRRKGIVVYLTHHTLDVKGRSSVDSKARGSDELSIRSHTEIIIIRKKEITNNAIYRKIVGTYYAKPGILLGLHFKVCKAAGIITGMIRWIHLPYNGNAWTVIDSTDNEGISMIEENEVQDANSNGDAIMDSNLSPDASKLLKHISETKTLSRNDAEAYLDCAEDKARKVLKELMDNKCINFIDKGRSSYYKLI